MKNVYARYVMIIFLFTGIINCKKGPDGDPPLLRTSIKIALVDSLSVEYDDDKRLLPDDIQKISAVLQSESKDCYGLYIPDPTLIRVDMNDEQFSLKTKIEKGGSKDVENPKVIGKLIKKNLDGLNIPKFFTKRRVTDVNVGILLSGFISSQAAKDSVLVFDQTDRLDSYSLNGKAYAVYSDVDEVRNRMLAILCENSKASFTILMNPPSVDPEPTPPIVNGPESETKAPPVVVIPPNPVPMPVSHGPKRQGINRTINGDLAMIKGTEGCDVCTRYYSATDNLGRQHEVKEKNSTFCCPCGKTIEMKGRTYRMECDGAGSNRLAEVTE